jgi:hypothetical protein
VFGGVGGSRAVLRPVAARYLKNVDLLIMSFFA